MMTVRLYMLQRITALLMAPLVLGHLAMMIFAIQGGVTAAEILGRTQGSMAWLLFYGGFVVAVSIHAAIGLRVVVHETFGLKHTLLDLFTWAVAAGLFLLGARAVMAVTLS